MYFAQVLFATCLLVGAISVEGYGMGGYGAGGYGAGGYGAGGYGAGGFGGDAPKPYEFGYVAGANGGSSFRSEKSDSSGNVQGSYGYVDSQGLQRKVEYIANAGGFQASVKTNEPGTDGKEDPADVQMNVQPPPPGIQEKYSQGNFGMNGGYGGGKY